MPQPAAHTPKVLIIYHDFGSAGPYTVVNRMTHALKARGAEVVVAGPERSMQWEFDSDPKKATITPLSFFSPEQQLMGIIRKQKPDIVIAEHFPFGSKDPLTQYMMKGIAQARKTNPNVQVYGITRDVPFFRPGHEAQDAEWTSTHAAPMVDHILVRGDKSIIDLKEFFTDAQWQRFADKVHYTGFMVPPPQAGKPTKGGGVVVHLGGAEVSYDVDTYRQIMAAIPTLGDALRQAPWHFVVSPFSNKKSQQALLAEFEKLPKDIRSHVTIEPMHADYLAQAQAADMLVVRGGHSLIEALSFGKPVLAIPRQSEQQRRIEGLPAQSLKRLRSIGEYHSADDRAIPMDPNVLRDSLNELYAQRRSMAPECGIRINGHEAAAQGIMDRYQGIETSFEGRAKA